jgi:hypothetical protein
MADHPFDKSFSRENLATEVLCDSFVDWIVAQPESERDASTRPRLGHEFNSVYQSSRPLN